MTNEIQCPKCQANLPVDNAYIGIRRHLLEHSMPSTLADAMALVEAQTVGTAPVAAAPTVPSPVPTPAAPVAGIQPLAGKVVAVAGSFVGYDQERVEQILIAAGAKVTDRRGLNRAAFLLAGSRIGNSVPPTTGPCSTKAWATTPPSSS